MARLGTLTTGKGCTKFKTSIKLFQEKKKPAPAPYRTTSKDITIADILSGRNKKTKEAF